jgi:hypothetical protein
VHPHKVCYEESYVDGNSGANSSSPNCDKNLPNVPLTGVSRSGLNGG